MTTAPAPAVAPDAYTCPVAEFTDSEGVVWKLEMTVLEYEEIKKDLGVNVFDLLEGEEYTDDDGVTREKPSALLAFANDLGKAAGAIYILCYDQAVEKGVVDERAFMKRLRGDALNGAVQALVRAIVNFCPNANRREVLSRTVEAGFQVEEAELEDAATKIRSVDLVTETRKTIAAQREASASRSSSIDSSGNAPASSGSTPDPSR